MSKMNTMVLYSTVRLGITVSGMGGLGTAGRGCQELDNLLAVTKHRQSINNISTKFYVFPLVLFRKAQTDAQTFLSAHDSSFRACLICPRTNSGGGQNRRGRPP